jgi:DNA-binding LytR/AlgR family response regulator
VRLADVLWIEAMGDYVIVHTRDKKYVLHSTLRTIESKLPEDKFVRVHRSYIVQIDNIRVVDSTTIYVENTNIPLGNLYKSNFMKRLGILG